MHASLIHGKQNGQSLVLFPDQTLSHLSSVEVLKKKIWAGKFQYLEPLGGILYKAFKIVGFHGVNSTSPMVSYAPSRCAIDLILHQPLAMLET